MYRDGTVRRRPRLRGQSEEKTFYEGFTVSIEQESDSRRIMKAAFTAFESPAESVASATETLLSVYIPSQPPFSVDKVLDTQCSKPSEDIEGVFPKFEEPGLLEQFLSLRLGELNIRAGVPRTLFAFVC
jgi:hypothetical protein